MNLLNMTKCWGYVVISSEPLCAEVCDFVQIHAFVNYVTFSTLDTTVYFWRNSETPDFISWLLFYLRCSEYQWYQQGGRKYSRLKVSLFNLYLKCVTSDHPDISSSQNCRLGCTKIIVDRRFRGTCCLHHQTILRHYRYRLINAVQGNNPSLHRESFETY
jgi:hypothetical protein